MAAVVLACALAHSAADCKRIPSDFLSGIHVEARGIEEHYAATTDEKGQFEIRVPTGRYNLRVVNDGRYFGTYDVSYEDADDIEIEPGGCAQIQLAVAGSGSAR